MRATSLFEDEFEKLVTVKEYLLRKLFILDIYIYIYKERIIVLSIFDIRERKI